MKIVFATNNSHKLEEIRSILGEGFQVLSLADIGCHEDIPETHETLEENSREKAEYVFRNYGIDCFADDTGLEVEALGGQPGVRSARYAEGTDHDSEANMNKLLREMNGKNNRNAQFRTVITFIKKNPDGDDSHPMTYTFEGTVKGKIAHEKHGSEGFGYDPIFVPEGYDHSFAEIGMEIKNSISHRARAVAAFAEFIRQQH